MSNVAAPPEGRMKKFGGIRAKYSKGWTCVDAEQVSLRKIFKVNSLAAKSSNIRT